MLLNLPNFLVGRLCNEWLSYGDLVYLISVIRNTGVCEVWTESTALFNKEFSERLTFPISENEARWIFDHITNFPMDKLSNSKSTQNLDDPEAHHIFLKLTKDVQIQYVCQKLQNMRNLQNITVMVEAVVTLRTVSTLFSALGPHCSIDFKVNNPFPEHLCNIMYNSEKSSLFIYAADPMILKEVMSLRPNVNELKLLGDNWMMDVFEAIDRPSVTALDAEERKFDIGVIRIFPNLVTFRAKKLEGVFDANCARNCNLNALLTSSWTYSDGTLNIALWDTVCTSIMSYPTLFPISSLVLKHLPVAIKAEVFRKHPLHKLHLPVTRGVDLTFIYELSAIKELFEVSFVLPGNNCADEVMTCLNVNRSYNIDTIKLVIKSGVVTSKCSKELAKMMKLQHLVLDSYCELLPLKDLLETLSQLPDLGELQLGTFLQQDQYLHVNDVTLPLAVQCNCECYCCPPWTVKILPPKWWRVVVTDKDLETDNERVVWMVELLGRRGRPFSLIAQCDLKPLLKKDLPVVQLRTDNLVSPGTLRAVCSMWRYLQFVELSWCTLDVRNKALSVCFTGSSGMRDMGKYAAYLRNCVTAMSTATAIFELHLDVEAWGRTMSTVVWNALLPVLPKLTNLRVVVKNRIETFLRLLQVTLPPSVHTLEVCMSGFVTITPNIVNALKNVIRGHVSLRRVTIHCISLDNSEFRDCARERLKISIVK